MFHKITLFIIIFMVFGFSHAGSKDRLRKGFTLGVGSNFGFHKSTAYEKNSSNSYNNGLNWFGLNSKIGWGFTEKIVIYRFSSGISKCTFFLTCQRNELSGFAIDYYFNTSNVSNYMKFGLGSSLMINEASIAVSIFSKNDPFPGDYYGYGKGLIFSFGRIIKNKTQFEISYLNTSVKDIDELSKVNGHEIRFSLNYNFF